MICPWCGSADVRELAPYGTLLMTAQWFCESCHSPFERVRHRGGEERRRSGDAEQAQDT